MKTEEAILRIKYHIEIHSRQEKPFAVQITKALIMAVEALKKQLPKKPARDKDGCVVCGNCGSYDGIRIGTSFNEGFCYDCGQAIDWSEYEKGGDKE